MKKILMIFTLALVLTLAVSTAAFAKAGVGNPKGEITAIDTEGGTVTIMTEDGELVLTLPEGYDFGDLQIGDYVVAKGAWTAEGFDADWVKLADDEETEVEETEEPIVTEETEEGEENGEDGGWGEGGVYCNGGKDKPHPVAQKIADKYGVSVEWVMSYACDGFGFGGVMLALQTQAANGEGGETADQVLAKKKAGQGWGQIWKDSGLTKTDKADSPPPGQLKKEEKQTGPPEDKGPNKVKPTKTNNGKKPEKNKNTNNGDDAEGQ